MSSNGLLSDQQWRALGWRGKKLCVPPSSEPRKSAKSWAAHSWSNSARGGGTASGVLAAKDYPKGLKAYLDNIRGEDGGIDTRGATEAFTDAGQYSPGTVGAAGILADPLNLAPVGKVGKAPALAGDLLTALKAGDVGAVGGRLGQAARAYPGALQDEATDVAKAVENLGPVARQAGKAALSRGVSLLPSEKGFAFSDALGDGLLYRHLP